MTALGGALGAGLRYGFLILFPYNEGEFPLTIFAENMTGSFFLGLVFALITLRWKPEWPARAFFGTGLLGSFTTFSNFTLDLVDLAGSGQWIMAVSYFLVSVISGLTAGFTGLLAGKKIAGKPFNSRTL